ncbi:putative metal-dependent phosphoesterase, PHP family [Halovivax ruber XH-70]|uniref:Putative metal-dependent phosphoesterase, PHP family n=1 Tax=Halovivax ruber (strain DSM 18193 / JCM 13892 / XH-70) TaxID=797302 RepID=L0I6Y5_HALRX|nr:PHP-associated domain-containing protein [Halovivax ruber]AGB15285.1 putative metal-dependent phosphoesterase, PHP family [Halovivax ruber XH-70]
MYTVDLHTHTRFFHGRRALGDRFDPVGHRLLTWSAARRGLDGLATTNHDYYTPFSAGRVVTIPGIEISTDRGHVLVVGPDPPSEVTPGELTPTEAVELAHDRDCAAIVAHPFRNSTVREVDDVAFDAIEVNGKHPRSLPLVEKLAETWDLPLVGGSDAHYPFEVGRAYTRIDAPELSPNAVVEAIRDGRVEYRIDRGPLDRFVRRLYRRVHERKGVTRAFERLDTGPTPGVGTPPEEPTTESTTASADRDDDAGSSPNGEDRSQ